MNIPNEKKKKIKNFKIPLLGIHNVKNAVAAIAVTLTIGIKISKIKMGLLNFKGVQRRFNKIFSFKGINFYDDYAHHPTEIKEVLNGVSKIYKKFEKICIFQPHRISRLNLLRKEFSLAFKKADTVILCPVYNAGEKIKLKFSYLKFARQIIKNSKVKLFMIDNINELIKFLKSNMFGKKIIIGMGAGSISSWMKEISRSIK